VASAPVPIQGRLPFWRGDVLLSEVVSDGYWLGVDAEYANTLPCADPLWNEPLYSRNVVRQLDRE